MYRNALRCPPGNRSGRAGNVRRRQLRTGQKPQHFRTCILPEPAVQAMRNSWGDSKQLPLVIPIIVLPFFTLKGCFAFSFFQASRLFRSRNCALILLWKRRFCPVTGRCAFCRRERTGNVKERLSARNRQKDSGTHSGVSACRGLTRVFSTFKTRTTVPAGLMATMALSRDGCFRTFIRVFETVTDSFYPLLIRLSWVLDNNRLHRYLHLLDALIHTFSSCKDLSFLCIRQLLCSR